MTELRMTVTHEEDTFLLGRLEGQECSGVFLPAEFLGRLRQVRHAVGNRFEVLGINNPPDALKNLLGIIDRITEVHADQMKAENAPLSEGDIEAYKAMQKEIEEAMKALTDISDSPDKV